MENLFYTIPLKCKVALGAHPTDEASFERWSNLDMIDCLWWMLWEEKAKVGFFLDVLFVNILKVPFYTNEMGKLL